MFPFTVLAATLLLAFSAVASPLVTPPQNLIAWNPTITKPDGNTSWAHNEARNVTWKTDDIPPEKVHDVGKVVVGRWINGSSSEHLDYTRPIASNFSYTQGWVECVMPDHYTPGDKYFIVLMGDSGNVSPTFDVIPSNATHAR